MKRLCNAILIAGIVFLSGCASGNTVNNTDNNISEEQKTSSADVLPAEGTVRYADHSLQYLNASGQWVTIPAEKLLETGKTVTEETKESVIVQQGSGSTSGTTAVKGAKGDKGEKGETGLTGASGTPGKDGSDGTAVTILETGELCLDGAKTGYFLIKAESSDNPCGQYHREQRDNACGACLPGYTEEDGYCKYTSGNGKEITLIVELIRNDGSLIRTIEYNVTGGEDFEVSIPEEADGYKTCKTKLHGHAYVIEGYDSIAYSVRYFKDPDRHCWYEPDIEPTPTPTPEPTPTPALEPTPTPIPEPTPEPEPMQTCWNGDVIPQSQACPASQTCADGSVIAADATCPVPEPEPETSEETVQEPTADPNAANQGENNGDTPPVVSDNPG